MLVSLVLSLRVSEANEIPIYELIYAEVEQIGFGITLFKNCEHDGDYFTCEYNERPTEQQYSIAIGLLSCIFAIKYVFEVKDLTHSIITTRNDPVGQHVVDDGFLYDDSDLKEKTGERNLLLIIR